MANARDAMFGDLRRALGVSGAERLRRETVEGRLARRPSGPIPARGSLAPAERLASFIREAERAHASIAQAQTSAEVPGAIAAFLRAHDLPATLRLGADLRLADMPWGEAAIATTQGPSSGADRNAASHAFAGVAETGTLVLCSGPDNPTSLNFLPENHFVVLRALDVTDSLETVWTALRARYGAGLLPRCVNLITGPSSSGDIEQTIVLGAHGPRRLHIILLGGA